ncbi:MAG: Rhs element Vgr protein [Acidimicrobiia bacterium]|nr:Rhs element Vgr protein [Acidimicrobiia bacterium]
MTVAGAVTGVSLAIEIGGVAVPDDVELVHAIVDDSLYQPDLFEVAFRDPQRILVQRLGARIGAPVKIGVRADVQGVPDPLISGEITAIEAEIDPMLNLTILRGYDESHRLFRGRVTAAYRNMSASDVAMKVAQRAGLRAGTIESTNAVHDHLAQANRSDGEFLNDLAREIGYEVVVSKGELHFRKPVAATTGPGKADLASLDPLQLLLGGDLMRLRSVVTSAGQVPSVEVRGWDFEAKRAAVGQAPAANGSAQISLTPVQVAAPFNPPPLVATSVPYSNGRDVDQAAQALAEEVASSFVVLEGAARGNPKLKAGVAVRVGLVGDPFDGKYVLNSTRHTYNAFEGYVTEFTVGARNDGSLIGAPEPPRGTMEGVVVALVDDVDDPLRRGRVRLQFPWLSDDYVSGWARVVQPGAGNRRGWVLLPEVGDEVLVAFDRADFDSPFVLGGLYNGKDEADLGGHRLLDPTSKAVDTRRFVSRSGSHLTFVDQPGEELVRLASQDGTMVVELDLSKKQVNLTSAGDVAIKAGANASLEATGTLTLKGASVSIEAQASLEAKAGGPVTVKGAVIQLN